MRRLRGRAERPYDGPRVPIEIHPTVRTALRDLLREEDMRGVGYSEFIGRAIVRAAEEKDEAIGRGARASE